MIDKQRTKTEIRALADICQEITWDLDEGWIELHGIPYPRGWQPRTGAIRFELPDTYPVGQPDAYLPEDMQYKGSRPMIMLRRGPPRWRKHCIHDFADKLNPNYDTLVSMTRLIYRSLQQPNKHNPFKKQR